MTPAQKVQNFGKATLVSRVGLCAICDQPLREMLLICADLYCCDSCGNVYMRHGDGELLCKIGRREVIK